MVEITVTIRSHSTARFGRVTETTFNFNHAGETPEERHNLASVFKERVVNAIDALLTEEND